MHMRRKEEHIMTSFDDKLSLERRLLWIALLTAASLVLSGVYACALPFAAFGALAALDGDRRGDGVLMIISIWLANQIIGFGFLGYPHEFQAYAWGAAILGASLIGFAAARSFVRAGSTGNAMVVIAGAFLAAFVGYQLGLYAATFVLPSSAGAFSYAVVSYVATVNVIAFVCLLGLHWVASTVGLVARNTLEMRFGTAS
jgi:hypothetical protein